MSSLQSLREFISERLAAAAEEIFRHCEGTIVQYEQELCRQRRLLDIRKPQLQLHHIDLPQRHLRKQEKNFHGRQEQQDEPESPPMSEEQGRFYICQDEEQLGLKQETDTLMEIPTYEESEHSEAYLNYHESFNATDSQDEEGSQHDRSTLSPDEETDPQNRDQRKRRDRSHVQNADGSHMSESRCDIDSEENTSRKNVLTKKHKRNRTVKKHCCKECGRRYTTAEGLKHHMQTHTGEKPYSRKEWNQSFRQSSVLTHHMLTHAGEKSFSCTECSKSFRKNSHLTRHMLTHTGEKPFSCTECSKSFRQIYHLKYHMLTHTQQKPLSCSSAPNNSSSPAE